MTVVECLFLSVNITSLALCNQMAIPCTNIYASRISSETIKANMDDLRVLQHRLTLGPAGEGSVEVPSVVKKGLGGSRVFPFALGQVSDFGILFGNLEWNITTILQLLSDYSNNGS